MKVDLRILWPLGALLVLVLLVAALGRSRRRADFALDHPWPLKARQPQLSQPEQVLLRRLIEALPGHGFGRAPSATARSSAAR